MVSDNLAEYHDHWSGAEMVCKTLSELLAKEGQEIIFFTAPIKKKVLAKNIFQIPTFSGTDNFFMKLFAPFYMAWGITFAFYYLLKTKPDIINFLHSNYLFFPVMTAAQFLKIPTVFTFLDYYLICPQGTFLKPSGKTCDQKEGKNCRQCVSSLKLLERRAWGKLKKKLKGVITFTETSKKRLITNGFPAEIIRVIYTYNLPSYFAQKIKEKIPSSVLAVASFHEHKGLQIILRAWPEVLKKIPKAALFVIGQGVKEDKERIENLAKNLKIENSIKFLGQRNNEEVLDKILESEIVVVAEQWPSEFGPLILLEAMALGCPVVAGEIGSVPDFVRHKVNGFLVQYNNPRDFSQKIVYLLSHKEEAAVMGEQARKIGKILFEYNQGRKTVEFYKEIINSNIKI